MKNKKERKLFTVYTASAGSGKTFRLTLEYLKIALRNPSEKFYSILAITFTVKATNEMKARIIDACNAIGFAETKKLSGRNAALYKQLLAETPYTEQELMERCRLLYRKILHNYSDFSISTIDSFSQRLLRSFAFELGLPVNFEIIIDPTETIEYLTNQLLAKVGGDDQAFNKLITTLFIEKLIVDDSIQIQSDIQKAAELMLSEESVSAVEKLSTFTADDLLYLSKAIDERFYQIPEEINAICTPVIERIEFEGVKESFLRNVGNEFFKFKQHPDQKFSNTFQKIIAGTGKWFKSGTEHPALAKYLTEQGIRLTEKVGEYKLYKAYKKSFTKMALITELVHLFRDYRRQEEVVLIGEFNRLISSEVKEQPAPFLFEKVGEQYQHVLIDEFQDTSVMQWHNLLPLVTEALNREGENNNLLVGDSKQAIYRFRGGETRQLSALPQLIGAEQGNVLHEQQVTLQRHIEKVNLDTNFRSRKEIVHFNNKLYTFIANNGELTAYHSIYENCEQKVLDPDSGGYVEVKLLDKRVDRGENKELIDDYYDRVFKQLLPLVLDAHDRGIPYHQMAVICRAKKELSALAQRFQDAGLLVSSKESLALNKSKYINAFVSLVRLFAYPKDQLLQAHIANILFDLGELNASRHEINQTIGRSRFQSISQLATFFQQLGSTIHLQELNQRDLFFMFEQYVNWLPMDIQQSAYISFMRNELWHFISTQGNNTEAFIEWWKKNNKNLYVKSGAGEQGIQLLTIHKAKGLEFEVVFMPFVNWKFTISNKKEERWVTPPFLPSNILDTMYLPLTSSMMLTPLSSIYETSQQDIFLDNLNLLYVATTRAVSELYLFVEKPNKKKQPIGTESYIHNFLAHILTEEGCWGKKITVGKEKKQQQDSLVLEREERAFGQIHVAVENRANVIWNEDVQGKIDFGEVVHGLFEQIRVKEDIEAVVDQAIASGIISHIDKMEIIELLNEVVSNESLLEFFSANIPVLAERAIITPEGNQFVPDRIIKTGPKTVKILDFKTGKYKKTHKEQINTYATLLTKMGYEVSSKQIVYFQPLDILML